LLQPIACRIILLYHQSKYYEKEKENYGFYQGDPGNHDASHAITNYILSDFYTAFLLD
jgi:hypothetical protein